ncbi:SpvB/TcaC N-terminal domain-containing protein [Mycobacterium kansasii]|uniref:SpvB/TcaC N-terminal domain-containing protein n=2 Tax=Mycobacterium kansasii TaxID=1768 RepID=UPI0009EF786A|nr:SpvB/TcaC N-terminal domain-containing protein [Mycobacterium kansasii]ARG55434.1 hypothetical protein B1T43_05590 [Mycobacterium kansasii]
MSQPLTEHGTGAAAPLALPKGGGAIRGIGEKFGANPVTGTGSLSIPIPASPGRDGFGPSLTLTYDSGSGNGPFGFGWTLRLASITRRTDRGLPRYRDAEESDVFVLADTEDLVPVLTDAGARWEDRASAPGYVIHRYRPRLEGLFARIERWTHRSDGDVHWRSFSRDNVLTIYGRDDRSRIRDPADRRRIFSWLVSETRDDRGNGILFDYVAENGAGVPLERVHERNRGDRADAARGANRYLKRVRYANRTTLLDENGDRPTDLTQAVIDTTVWMMEVVFDYDEGHFETLPPAPGVPVREQHALVRASPQPAHAWAPRPDPFSTFRPGFEIRTVRRCRRALVFHHIPDVAGMAEPVQPGYDGLVAATHFDYNDLNLPASVAVEHAHEGSTRYGSFLCAVTQSGYRHADAPGTELEQSLPPVQLRYSRPAIQEAVRQLDAADIADLPAGLDARRRLVDLDGEGLPGILADEAGWWYYKANLGGGQFDAAAAVSSQPRSGRDRLIDLDGDGRPALVCLDGPVPGYYERAPGVGWENLRAFEQLPALMWDDPALRFVDVDGDGRPDVLVTEDEALAWYPFLGDEGFGERVRVPAALDEELGPRVVLADALESIQLADMSGDGLADIVRIRNGDVCYWPNLGYGRFGAKITLDDVAPFDDAEAFDQRRIRLADIDGSGTTDLIYLADDGIRLYFNRSGNSLSEARPLPPLPHLDDVVNVLAADLLGNGTACLVWSSALPADAAAPIRYLDLMGGAKPHLLVATTNNMGAETRVEYAASTQFYLADKRAGVPWPLPLPFPVHVVERIVVVDHISGNRYGTRFAYHYGYFDVAEREFRGFAKVEQWDSEAFAALDPAGAGPGITNLEASSQVPPAHTVTWFHTGQWERRAEFDAALARDYYGDPQLGEPVLPAGLSVDEEREARRALKGSLLRREVYGLDGTRRQPHPYSVTESISTVRCLQRRAGNRHAVFHTAQRETVTLHYEREPDDPRVQHDLTLEVDDHGNVVRAAQVVYGRAIPDGALPPEEQAAQAAVHVLLAENRMTDPLDEPSTYREPVPCEQRRFEVTGIPPPAAATRYGFDDLARRTAQAAEIPFEATPTGATAQKRVVDHRRAYFRRDDLNGPAPLGSTGRRALLHQRYALALTPGLVDQVYGTKVTAALLDGTGRYAHPDGHAGFWTSSTRELLSPGATDSPAQEFAYARAHFFRPLRLRDPFHTAVTSTESFTVLDAHDLLVFETRDALGNTTRAVGLDYRVLRPSRLADPNGNVSAVAYDAFGVVAGSAVMGKPAPAPAEGDTLDGFVADPTPAQVQDLLADPRGPLAATLLAGATTRTIVDRNAFLRTPAGPPVTVTIVREVHVSELPAGAASPLQVRLAYSDGLGRQVQTKAQARAGPVAQRDAAGAVIVGADGQPVLTAADADPRWVASGWTVYNNKGFAVRQYQPFYTDRHQFEFDVRVGVSPITFYDPLGRTVGVLHPDHTWQKTVVGAWRSESWDANDTVALVGAADDDVGGFFERLPAAAHVPTWAALRTDPALSAARWPDPGDRAAHRRAAEQAMVHAATPTVAHSDSLGRAVLTVVTNRYKYSDATPADPPTERSYRNRDVLDILGRRRAVIDARGRTVLRAAFDLQGNRIHEASMEAGARWSLTDAIGGALVSWDDKGRRFTTRYDVLRRPTGTVLTDGGADILVADTIYGESRPDPQAANLRGRAVELRDQSGSVTTDRFDFAGNPLRVERALVADYRSVIDWSGPVDLENERYLSATRFDALNRPIQVIAPHSSQPGAAVKVLQQQYDQGSLLRRLDVWIDESDEPTTLLDPASADVPALADVRYDAQGRRIQVDRGNGVRTTARYHPLTQRLAELQTRRTSAAFADCPDPPPAGWPGCQLQNQRFVHDPSGNIAAVRDLAQQAIFFRNRRVTADSDYTYDAFYRLIEATGREHIGQAAPSPATYNDVARLRIPHPADGNAMARYLERYTYDDVGNLQAVAHVGTDPANPGWTRTYAYAEASLLEPAQHSNRLTSTTADAVTDVYEYDEHGNTLKMPQLQAIQWDFADRMRMTRRQAVNAGDADGTAHAGERTYYVYGAGGERLRKVTVTAAGVVVQDRIQLGGVEILRRAGPSPMTQEILHIPDGSATLAIVETTLSGGPPGAPKHLVRHQVRDQLGSAAVELDDQARILSFEEYTPYGATTYQAVRSQTETPKRFRFLGAERDEESGLQHLGARYYAPWLGRFVSCDPIGIEGGTCLYAYSRANPVTRKDPGGMGDEPTAAGGITITSGGKVSAGPFVVNRDPSKYVVAFGPGMGYMDRAEHNTGLIPLNIQDKYNWGRPGTGPPAFFPSGPELEKQFQVPNSQGQRRDLYPMFSALMTEEALEGKVASTVHFDMRKVNPTPKMPPLVPGDPEASTPGYSWADFHSSAEARRVLAHLADTAPGDRKVDIFIEHEDGISIIRKGSGAVEGAPLPQRLAKFVPNLNNGGTRGSGGGTGTAPTGGGAPGGGSKGGGSRGGPSLGQRVGGAVAGAAKVAIPGVVETEAIVGSSALLAYGLGYHTAAATLLTVAEAVPVVAAAGAGGALAGLAARNAAKEYLGATQQEADTIGLLAAVGVGAAIGSVIPGVGTAVGAAIGAAVAGIAYLFSIW